MSMQGYMVRSVDTTLKECKLPGIFRLTMDMSLILRAVDNHFYRDIYYAKYYGMRGGGNYQLGKK